MRKLGKNKKKQWKHCYAGLEDKLTAVQKQNQITKDGFLLGKVEKKKHRIIKGDKNSAKAYPEIPTAAEGALRFKQFTVQKSVRPVVDLWANESQSATPKTDPPKQIPLPAPGQSYNPSLEDHLTMLSALAKAELEKRRREAKTERFLKGLGSNRPAADPLDEARSFIQNLSQNPVPVESSGAPNVEEVAAPRKSKKVNKEKRMAVELENIPKLLKEIKRENQARKERKKLLKAKKQHRKQLRQMDLDVPFQLPNELVPALRKLTPECDLLREVEKRKNKCPRARKTLGLVKNTKSFERR